MKKILFLGLIVAGLFAQYYDPRKYINSHGLDSCRVYRHDGAGSDTIFFRAYLTSSTVKADSGIFNYLSGAIAAAKKSDSLYNKGSYVYGQYFLRDNVPDTASYGTPAHKIYTFGYGNNYKFAVESKDSNAIFVTCNDSTGVRSQAVGYALVGDASKYGVMGFGDSKWAGYFTSTNVPMYIGIGDYTATSETLTIFAGKHVATIRGTGVKSYIDTIGQYKILDGTQIRKSAITADTIITWKMSIGGTAPAEQFEVRNRQYFGAVLAMTDGIYNNLTAEAKISDGAEYRLMAFQDDTLWVGKINDSSTETFTNVWFDIQSPGTDVTLVPTYWNGSAWSALSITDGTSNFTVDGSISFSVPGNWTSTTVHGVTGMFIMLVTSTNPTIDPYAYVTVPDTTDLFGYYIQAGDVTPGISMDKYGRTYFITGNDSIIFFLNSDTTLYVHQNNRYGIYARANDSFAIFGTADKKAIYGYANDYGVWGFGADYGVYGETSNNFGVYGNATNWYGTCGLASQYGAYGYGSTKYGGLFVSPNIGLFAALDKTTPTSDTVAIFGMSDNYYPSWGTNFYPRSYIDSLGQYHIIGGTQIRKNAIAVDTIAIPTALDTNYLYASNDTLFLKSKLGSQYLNLTQATVLFKPGWMLFDQMKPATNDSVSSSLGDIANPYGHAYICTLSVRGKSPMFRVVYGDDSFYVDSTQLYHTLAGERKLTISGGNVLFGNGDTTISRNPSLDDTFKIFVKDDSTVLQSDNPIRITGAIRTTSTINAASSVTGSNLYSAGLLSLAGGNAILYYNAFLQGVSVDFSYGFVPGIKGDCKWNDGTNSTIAENANFIQYLDSTERVVHQFGGTNSFKLGMTGNDTCLVGDSVGGLYSNKLIVFRSVADTTRISGIRIRAESDSICKKVAFAGVNNVRLYIPGLATTDIVTLGAENAPCVAWDSLKTDSLIIRTSVVSVLGAFADYTFTGNVNYIIFRK